MFNEAQMTWVIASLVAIAAGQAFFLAWNCILDMLWPPWRLPERTARAITRQLGSGLSHEKQVRLYALVLRILRGMDGGGQGVAVRR
jgi:hypothetical protein